MEIKQEDLYNKLLCVACLCVGRDVYEITNEKLLKYYTDALDEIPLTKSIEFGNLRVCWDCKFNLQKCCSFKEQVKDSYRIMQSYTSENFHECFHTDLSKPPRLVVFEVASIDIPPSTVKKSNESQTFQVKGENAGSREFDEDSSTNKYEEDSSSKKSIADNIVFEMETEIVICPFEEDDKSRRDKKSKKSAKRLNIAKEDLSDAPSSLDMEDASNPPSETEDYLKIPEVEVKGEVLDTWVSHQDNQEEGLMPVPFENNILEENKIETELQTIISSIEKEDKKSSEVETKDKKNKRLKLQKSKRPSYKEKISTVELSYEEMLSEREKELTRESYTKAEYKCETCIIGFHYKRSYMAHLGNKHASSLGEYICPICKTIVASVDSFTSHYKRHLRRYECSICKKRTTDLKVMQQHFYSTHEISLKEYTCNICGHVSNSIDTHRYHKDSHKARIQCTQCDKTFRHRTGLLNHRLVFHEVQNPFPCTLCDKVFRWKTSLRRHLVKHDAKKSPPGPYCSMCCISFSSLCSYQKHMKSSLKHVTQDQHKYICDHCNRRYSEKAILREHIEENHLQSIKQADGLSSVMWFICDYCNRRFVDKTKLRDHIEEKHLYKTYQCDICSKQSKNRVGLDQHIRNVHKGRPKNKMCHHCGRGFPTKMQLESHIRTHTGERPFICEFCPTTFSQKSNLYKHNRQVHLNIKSKRYPVCKKNKEDDGEEQMATLENEQEDDPYQAIVLEYTPDNPPTLML